MSVPVLGRILPLLPVEDLGITPFNGLPLLHWTSISRTIRCHSVNKLFCRKLNDRLVLPYYAKIQWVLLHKAFRLIFFKSREAIARQAKIIRVRPIRHS